MNKNKKIKCPCCGELITIEKTLSENNESDEELLKILKELNIEFG